jgi:hypothetical protein
MINILAPYQRSVNEYWSSILGNLAPDWLQAVRKESFAAFIGKTDYDTLPAPS